MGPMKMASLRYNPREIESKWQSRWQRDNIYHVADDDPRPKWYELTMYPYPSGDLHIGHWFAFAPADAHARFRRMQGYNVLHPMGFDAFGLPAENAAIKRGTHPYTWTMSNIENMRQQLRSMGTIYDWEREIICCLPEYYQWSQWLFLKFYKAGLAYRAKAPANWCPSCKTVLANEQVVNGLCERCDTTVTRRELDQWLLKTTNYADQLLDFSGLVDWPDRIKTMQANWIGRSEGTEVTFDISQYGLEEQEITTFTTRIDTIYGVTFIVLAPEHPLVTKLTTKDQNAAVQTYIGEARRQSEVERLSTERTKTGVFTGAHAINRLTGDKVPILVADYVLISYGTGIVMGVPAHDQRDFDFAKKYDLSIKIVIAPPGWDGKQINAAYVEEGIQVNSGPFDGMPNSIGKKAIAAHLENKGWGKRSVSYHLRDWLISRQRYWGTPIPIVHCTKCGVVAVSEKDLPVLLPQDAEFKPTGESPLKYSQTFLRTQCPKCDGQAHRETDTLDTFFDSSWYFLRYVSPHFSLGPFEDSLSRKWGPVDQYTGGAEHAVMHLLYARFFTKALRDLGLVDFGEPFLRLFNQGIILGEDHDKMSKSRGNVVNPDEYVQALGADAVRCFLMFLGPWDQGGPWSTAGINGVARWLNRVWETFSVHPNLPERSQLSAHQKPKDDTLRRELHRKIKQVTNDLERFKFNTAIAALMTYTNALAHGIEARAITKETWEEVVGKFLTALAPLAPHLAEELWDLNNRAFSVHNQPFPDFDASLAAEQEFTLVIQVNGKVRDKMTVPSGLEAEEAKRLAISSAKMKPYLDGVQVLRTIYVPGRLVNIVVK